MENLSTLIWLLVFACSFGLCVEAIEFMLSPNRTFFTKYDAEISCISKENEKVINTDLMVHVFDTINAPFMVSGNTLIPLKRIKDTFGSTIACLHKGVEVLRRTIVYIPKPVFQIRLIPDASDFAMDSVGDIECSVDPWADGFTLHMRVLGEEPVHREEGRFAKLTTPRVGKYYFLCSATGLGMELRKFFQIKVLENLVVHRPIIFDKMIYYLSDINMSTIILRFVGTRENDEQIGIKFIAGDDILSIKACKISLNKYARPGQIGTYQITNNRVKEFTHTFSVVQKDYHSMLPKIDNISDFETTTWKCGFGYLPISVIDLEIKITPKHHPFAINGNTITRIHGFGGKFYVDCVLKNGNYPITHSYKSHVLSIAELRVEPKTTRSYSGNEPEFRCFVHPPNELFKIQWKKPIGSSSSHVSSTTDSSLLVPARDAPFGKALYTCVADAQTVHLSHSIFFEVRELPPEEFDEEKIVIRPANGYAFVDDLLPSHSCQFNYTIKYVEGFSWKYVKGDKIMNMSENLLFVLPNMTEGQTGTYSCYYNGFNVSALTITLIGKAEMELDPPNQIVKTIDDTKFSCFLKGTRDYLQFIQWLLPDNNAPFVSVKNVVHLTKFQKGEWPLICTFTHGIRLIKKIFLIKIRYEIFMRIMPPVSHRTFRSIEHVHCDLVPYQPKVWVLWTHVSGVDALRLAVLYSWLIRYPLRWKPGSAVYECNAHINEFIHYSMTHYVDLEAEPPERLHWWDAKLNFNETFVFVWDTRPICCVFEQPDDKFNYALWWQVTYQVKDDNKFELRGNCLHPISPSHGDRETWVCIFNGHVAFKRTYTFLGSNETELVPDRSANSEENVRRQCRFKNATEWSADVLIRPVWESSSYILEGLELIYFSYTPLQMVMVYCFFEYRGEHFRSKPFDVASKMAWVPSLNVSHEGWSTTVNASRHISRNELTPITCNVVSPFKDYSEHFLATWTINSNNSFYKVNPANPQILLASEGVVSTQMSCMCSVKLLGKLFSVSLKITISDFLFFVNTGPELVIGATPLSVNCLSLPKQIHLSSHYMMIMKNVTEVETVGTFTTPHNFLLATGTYTVICGIFKTTGIMVPRKIYVKDIPDLVLSDPLMINFIVDGVQVAECVIKWKTSGGEQVGRVAWCELKESDNAYAQKNKLFFNIPPTGYKKMKVKCCFDYMNTKVKKHFTFHVYDPRVIEIGSLPHPSKQILDLKDPCDDLCQTSWPQINTNKGFRAQIVNAVVVGKVKSSLEIVVKNNTYSCKNVDQPVCFETTCLATLNSYHFRPVTRRRCYSRNLNNEIQMLPNGATVSVGGSYVCLLKDMTVHISVYSWLVMQEDGSKMPLSTGIMRAAIHPSYEGQTITVMCAPHHTNLVISGIQKSILVLATLNVGLTHANANCIQPGETLTCVTSSSVTKLKMILRLVDEHHFYKEWGDDWVRVPQHVYLAYYRFGCRVQEVTYTKTKWFIFPTCVNKPQLILSRDSVRMGTAFSCRVADYNASKYRLAMEGIDGDDIFRKYCPLSNAQGISMFDVICPAGNVLVRCSAFVTHNNSEKLIASTVFRMELIAYESYFENERISHGKIRISLPILILVLWLSVLTVNICAILYLHQRQNIKRCILLQFMHEWNLGGARRNIYCETQPFLYLMRKEINADGYLNLRNCIKDYNRFLDIGETIFFLWFTESDPVRLELLKAVRRLLVVSPGGASKYWSISDKSIINLYQEAKNFHKMSRRNIRSHTKSNFGAFLKRI